MMRAIQPRAFTIVELMVTVGIIVILVAILVPSLEAAMSAARRASCASNQRQLVAGSLAYANENNLFLPPVSSDGDNLSSVYAPRWFISKRLVAPVIPISVNPATPNPTGDVVVWNLGFLWFSDNLPGSRAVPTPSTSKGHIREASVYFCPAQTHEAFTEETYATSQNVPSFPAPKPAPVGRDWEPIDESGLPVPVEVPTSGVRLPYFYNPIMDNPDPAMGGVPRPLFQRVTELDHKKDSTAAALNWSGMLILDTIEPNPDVGNAPASTTDARKTKYSTISHAEDRKRGVGGWNVSFGDNTTIWVPDGRTTAHGTETHTVLEEIDEAYADPDAGVRRESMQAIYRLLSVDE